MTPEKAIACTLGADGLHRRLAEISAVGTANLIAHQREGGRHILRFRPGAETRNRLEAIVAAEAECCSFLDLELAERDGELVLTVVAPEAGQPFADELALAFTRTPDE